MIYCEKFGKFSISMVNLIILFMALSNLSLSACHQILFQEKRREAHQKGEVEATFSNKNISPLFEPVGLTPSAQG